MHLGQVSGRPADKRPACTRITGEDHAWTVSAVAWVSVTPARTHFARALGPQSPHQTLLSRRPSRVAWIEFGNA